MNITSSSPQPMRRRRSTAKLLARLNPKGMGIPDGGGRGTSGSVESAIDIAAALGYIGAAGPGPRLAAMTLCLRWWPGLFEGAPKVVARHDVVRTQNVTRITSERERVFVEHPVHAGVAWRRLKREEQTIRYTESMPVEMPSETESFRVLAGILETRMGQRLARAREAGEEWHKTGLKSRTRIETPIDAATFEKVSAPGFLARWARAVIHEYRHPNQCPTCLGYGERLKMQEDEHGKVKAVVTGCEECGGQGVTPWSVKRRGKAVRIGEHVFRGHLNRHHDGALALLRELEHRGATALLRRLGLPDD